MQLHIEELNQTTRRMSVTNNRIMQFLKHRSASLSDGQVAKAMFGPGPNQTKASFTIGSKTDDYAEIKINKIDP
jgi:hypothetical protein